MPIRVHLAVICLCLLGCRQSARDPYDGIPLSKEFPADRQKLMSYIDAHAGYGDVHAMRQHAWYLFDQLTRPSSFDASLPRWTTWYQWGDSFERTELTRLVLTNPFRLSEKDLRITRGIEKQLTLYNRDTYKHLSDNCFGDPDRLDFLRDVCKLREVPEFPKQSVVLKPILVQVNPKTCQSPVPVWNFKRPVGSAVVNPDESWPDSVLITSNPAMCASQGTSVNIDRFYHVKASSVEVQQQDDDLEFVLVGMHVITAELKNWTWATFWWHDHPADGPYAEGRPSTLKGPWNNYLMTVSYDMDRPAEPDARPHIAYNPYLEGHLPDGVTSNCMTCHRRSAWSVEGPITTLLSDGTLYNSDFQTSVVRGSRAAQLTYFNEPLSEKLKLSFLWSLASDHGKKLPRSGTCSQCPAVP